jgi:tRNA (guanine37-N1)-methyltransferase
LSPALDIEVLTLFPSMIEAPLAESVLGKAQKSGICRFTAVDIRGYAAGKHRVTDDSPYGGGAGMLMKPEPVVSAIEASRGRLPGAKVFLLSPQGRPFDQQLARELAALPAFVLVCGRYEGVDERVLGFVDGEISLGDFVLSGGEFAALAIIDASARLVPGVLGNEASVVTETFNGPDLEYPQYTRPPEFRGLRVPEVLLSGDHAAVARWRADQSRERTRDRRPDLLEAAESGLARHTS